jgi:hypothetical protein
MARTLRNTHRKARTIGSTLKGKGCIRRQIEDAEWRQATRYGMEG